MPNRSEYIDFLIEQFLPMGEISVRGMFGGHTLYCNGVVFGLVGNNELYLKADDQNRPEFDSRGLRAFRPFEDNPGVMQYYQAPPEIFEDPDALKQWASGAIAAGQRAQAKKKLRKKR